MVKVKTTTLNGMEALVVRLVAEAETWRQGLNVSVPLPNDALKTPTPSEMVFGDGTFGR